MSAVQIDVWSDFVCPFCYLAEPALDRIAREHVGEVLVAWRAYELRPDPEPTLDPAGEYLRNIWAESVYPMAAERGMKLRLPPVQPRSRLANIAAAYAAGQGRGAEMRRAIFRAFFERGENIGLLSVLTRLATDVGLEAAPLAEAVGFGEIAQQVLDDAELARELGLGGVPAIVLRQTGAPFEQAVLLEGVQDYEAIMETVGQVARGEIQPNPGDV